MGVVSQKLRDSARGQKCTLQLPGVCIGGTETTVLAHIHDDVSGMSTKANDWSACFACAECHRAYDLRLNKMAAYTLAPYLLSAMQRTQRIWFEMGLLAVPVTQTRSKPSSKIVPHSGIYKESAP